MTIGEFKTQTYTTSHGEAREENKVGLISFWFNLILKLLLSNLKLELLTGQIIHQSVYVYNLTIKKGGKVFGNLTIIYFQIMNISMKSKRSYKKY